MSVFLPLGKYLLAPSQANMFSPNNINISQKFPKLIMLLLKYTHAVIIQKAGETEPNF